MEKEDHNGGSDNRIPFRVSTGVCRGIPGVTLQGTKTDYLNILKHIDSYLNAKKQELGGEFRAFACLLKAISESIDVFDKGSKYQSGFLEPQLEFAEI